MPILLKLLDHELHKARSMNAEAGVLWIETPASSSFLPSIVSSHQFGRFLISRKLTAESRLRSGTFQSSEETIDQVIPSLFNTAYELSALEKFPNIFSSSKESYKHIQDSSGQKGQPHACLVPSSLSDAELGRIFKGMHYEDDTLNKTCRVYKFDLDKIVFLSRPDFVGLYTRLPNNYSSILLHNISLGIGFCVI